MAWKEHGGAPRRVLRPLRQSGSPFLVVSEEGRFSTWQLSRHSTSLHSREGMFDTKAVRTVGRDGKANLGRAHYAQSTLLFWSLAVCGL